MRAAPASQFAAREKAMCVRSPQCPTCSTWLSVLIKSSCSDDMKKLIYSAIFIVALSFVLPTFSFAQGTGYYNSSTDSAAIQSQQQEELEGRNILDNLSNKTISCSRIQDADFEKIGEYFMGQPRGGSVGKLAKKPNKKSVGGGRGKEKAQFFFLLWLKKIAPRSIPD